MRRAITFVIRIGKWKVKQLLTADGCVVTSKVHVSPSAPSGVSPVWGFFLPSRKISPLGVGKWGNPPFICELFIIRFHGKHIFLELNNVLGRRLCMNSQLLFHQICPFPHTHTHHYFLFLLPDVAFGAINISGLWVSLGGIKRFTVDFNWV